MSSELENLVGYVHIHDDLLPVCWNDGKYVMVENYNDWDKDYNYVVIEKDEFDIMTIEFAKKEWTEYFV